LEYTISEAGLDNKAVWIQDTVEEQEFQDGYENDPTP